MKKIRLWYDFSPRVKKTDVEELNRTQDFMIDNGLQRKRIDVCAVIEDTGRWSN